MNHTKPVLFKSSVPVDFFRQDGEHFGIVPAQIGQPVAVPDWVLKQKRFQQFAEEGLLIPDEGEANAPVEPQEAAGEPSATGMDKDSSATAEAPETPKKARKRKADEA